MWHSCLKSQFLLYVGFAQVNVGLQYSAEWNDKPVTLFLPPELLWHREMLSVKIQTAGFTSKYRSSLTWLKHMYDTFTYGTTHPVHPHTKITAKSVLYKHMCFKTHDSSYQLSEMNLSQFGLSCDPCAEPRLPTGPVICGWNTQTATTSSNALL